MGIAQLQDTLLPPIVEYTLSLVVSKAVVTASVLSVLLQLSLLKVLLFLFFLRGSGFLENWVLSLVLLLLLCFLLDSRCNIVVRMFFLLCSCFVLDAG